MALRNTRSPGTCTFYATLHPLPRALVPLSLRPPWRRSPRLPRSFASRRRFRAIPSPSPSPSPQSAESLDDSSFLSSLMPKKEIGADRFLDARPEQDGRGVLIAIFDSGVDPAAAGMQVTSDGNPKILDIIDCTGSDDIDTSEVVRADGGGRIKGRSGKTLIVNPSWRNPSGDWHVGCKLIYDLFPEPLRNRLKKERKKIWDRKNRECLSEALKLLNDDDGGDGDRLEDISLRNSRKDLEFKVNFLKRQAEILYNDVGPVVDAVVWNDGCAWRVALDTEGFEWDEDGAAGHGGKLADFPPMTNYRLEKKHGVFSKLDLCSFVTNVYNNGDLLSLVTVCSSHGTHVAATAAAFHPQQPLLNGVAPGAQLVSCKISDSRLNCTVTGTALTRALIAAVEQRCDLINMSSGQLASVPDNGRFVDLINEIVGNHRVMFVCSVGNIGPALSTVRSPGGTTSTVLGVGAYVSRAMASGAHCLVDPQYDGLEYTWSSRGPALDGDLGISLSAPGGADAPVPAWTLQQRMLKNGTSMASPCACGGVALLISALKVKGMAVSPYLMRKALENTAVPIGDALEDKLSTGHGLMQVDRAFEYLLRSRNLPQVWYQVKIIRSGGEAEPVLRGIYLRESISSQRASEWSVHVEPKFHEDANMEELVLFQECIRLISSERAVVKCPDHVLVTHNRRSFNIIIDPTHLPHGLHYYEIRGIDCKDAWRGPVFTVPITIVKPESPAGEPPVLSASGIPFGPGKIVRKFIQVPSEATWLEASLRTSGFDTARKFFIEVVQIHPLRQPVRLEHTVTFSSPSQECFNFPVKGGLTLELTIAQFWNSGVGSNESTLVDFDVVFHGINVESEEMILDGSQASVRMEVKSQLCSEMLSPVAVLNKIRTPHRPVHSRLNSVSLDRDKLPSGKQIMSLILTYKFRLDKQTEIKPYMALLNGCFCDTQFESQFYVISDSNKRVYATGNVCRKHVSLPKGEYNLQLIIRHDDILFLEKMKQLVLFIERAMDRITLGFFSQPDGPVIGNYSFKPHVLAPGILEAFYVGPPGDEMIPKGCPAGSVLLGKVSYGKASSVNKSDQRPSPLVFRKILYLIPPSKVGGADKHSPRPSTITNNYAEQLNEHVRDVKLKFLSNQKLDSSEKKLAWKDLCSVLKMEYPRYTPLLSIVLNVLVSQVVEDAKGHSREILNAANEVIESIDKDELGRYFSERHDPDGVEPEEVKKRMTTTHDELADALYHKGMALTEMECDQSHQFDDNFLELKKWVNVKSSKYVMLSIMHEKRKGTLGTALVLLDSMIQEEPITSNKKLYDLKIQLLEEIGWDHLASHERQWMQVRFPPCLPPLF